METNRLIILTTRLPPQVCGIGTYSWLLYQVWPNEKAQTEFVVVEGSAQSMASLGQPRISEFNGNPTRLLQILDQSGEGDLFLHYAGRAYSRYGVPGWLPSVIEKWKRKFPAGRLLIFFHEMPGHLPWTTRYFWLDKLNRRVISQLAAKADAIVTNTQEHADQLNRLSGRRDIRVVAVPSNIEPPTDAVSAPAQGEFALLGLPFGRWQTLRCFKRELALWQERGYLKRLHLIGPNDDKFTPRSRELLQDVLSPSVVTEHGMLPAEEVSRLLLRSQYGLSNSVEATWSKSSIFMAYAAHGCNVIVGKKSASEPLSLAIAIEEVGNISDVDLASRSAALRRWYESHATWPVIAQKIAELLPPRTDVRLSVSDEVIMMTPEAAGTGGVGDYARRMVEALPNPGAIRTEVWPVGSARLAKANKLLVQYSAYGFERHGYPRQLIRELLDWKKHTGRLLVIMFHEIWTFWPAWNKNALVQFFHRRGIAQLVRAADVVFTTTSRQAEYLGEFAPNRKIGVIPVGSNIPVMPGPHPERHPDWAVLFGLAGTRIRALREMHEELCALASKGGIARIMTLGESEPRQSDEERRLLAAIPLREGFEQLGRQPAPDVSKQLLSVGFGISDLDELSLTKSGTLMAYAAHGLNVLNPFANKNGQEPINLLVSPQELIDGLTSGELEGRARRLRQWQEHVSSWHSIAAEFSDALELG